MKKPTSKITAWTAAALLVGYAGSYLYLRGGGEYHLSATGQLRPYGIALFDLIRWSPRGCWWEPDFVDVRGEATGRGNGWGAFYSPLIRLDRKFFFSDRLMTRQLAEHGIRNPEP